jgi:hypothetical protein
LIDEKTRLKVEYLKMKKQFEDYEKKEKHEDREQSESLDVFVESVRNISNSIVISDLIIFKKLFDSSIFIDEKNSNIEN